MPSAHEKNTYGRFIQKNPPCRSHLKFYLFCGHDTCKLFLTLKKTIYLNRINYILSIKWTKKQTSSLHHILQLFSAERSNLFPEPSNSIGFMYFLLISLGSPCNTPVSMMLSYKYRKPNKTEVLGLRAKKQHHSLRNFTYSIIQRSH